MGSGTEAAAPKKTAAAGASAGTKLRVTIVLALLLVAVGVAGAGALKLLVHAMRPPTADDTAQIVCTAFQRQDYPLLVQQIDTAPVPPATGGPLDVTALRAQLASQDTAYGKVVSCKYIRIGTSGNPAQYAFNLQRAHAKSLTSLVVYIVREPDGSWKIRSDSELANPPN
ncbi:MAG TPA: hypothetical protein VKQ30_19295 [Ktedonobacterales bacterium]|nr:hypothetical protein [Ktedonobacterales bacterium]